MTKETDAHQTKTKKSKLSEKISELNDTVLSISKERDEWKNKYLYSLAEFDNYKKHNANILEQARDNVTINTLLELLPVLDDLERVCEDATNNSASIKDGINCIIKKYKDILSNSFSVNKLETNGETFNDEYHNAIMSIPTQNKEQDCVICNTVKAGYTYKDKIMRFADVIVYKHQETEN